MLSTKIDGLLAGLEARKAQSAIDDQRARDHVAAIEKEKHNLSTELDRVRDKGQQADAAHSQLSVELAILSTRYEGLSV